MERRRLVTRACAVCEWRDEAVEAADGPPLDCPWCHAPTRIVDEQGIEPSRGERNPHAVELGRLGGLKGGRVRAERLSARRRREIARQAAEARWRRR